MEASNYGQYGWFEAGKPAGLLLEAGGGIQANPAGTVTLRWRNGD